MNLRYLWLDDDYTAQPAWHRATTATLRIEIGDNVVTRHLRLTAGEVREEVVVPLYEVAEWVCRRWFSLMYEPRRLAESEGPELHPHSLRQATAAYALPDLRVWGGTQMELKASPYKRLLADIEFLDEARERVEPDQALEVWERLINSVIERLRRNGVENTPLEEEWRAIQTLDADEYRYAVLCGRFGFDPFNDKDYSSLLQPFSNAGLEELAEDLSEVYDASEIKIASAVVRTARGAANDRCLSLAQVPIVKGTRHTAHERGWNTAISLRSELGDDLDRLVEKIADLPPSINLKDNRISSVINSNLQSFSAWLPRGGSPSDRRFWASRAIYDHVTAIRPTVRAATPGTAPRQVEGRAFAAEVVAPVAKVRREVGTRKILGQSDIAKIAQNLNAPPFVVHHQVENHHIARILTSY